MLAPNSKHPRHVFQTNSTDQTKEMLPSPTSPTKSQTYTSLHSSWEKSWWSRRWSTVFPLHRHIQHQFAREKPFLMRLSTIRIHPHTATHIRNTTLLGILTRQNDLPWERNNINATYSIIKANIKLIVLVQAPYHSIFPFLPRHLGINVIKKRMHLFQFPILNSSIEPFIPSPSPPIRGRNQHIKTKASLSVI